jgi:Putative zinc-finger
VAIETYRCAENRTKVIIISCREVWREISNYIDEIVDPALKERMEAHFLACNHCSAILDGTRNVVRLIADGVELEIPKDLGERLYKKIKE